MAPDFWDNIVSSVQGTVATQATAVGQTAAQWLGANAATAIIKTGVAPTGNLTPEQLAAGVRGSTAPVAPSQANALELKLNQFGLAAVANNPNKSLILVGAACVAAFFLLQRGRK